MRIALLEAGLDALVIRQEVTRARLCSAESDVLALNPIGRVPTLQLDDGTILTASKLILDYIDALNPMAALYGSCTSVGTGALASR